METKINSMKANDGTSKSGNTWYYKIKVPAGVLTIKTGVFCGTSSKEYDEIENINWVYNFGKNTFL